MRKKLLDFLKVHNEILQVFYFIGHYLLVFIGWFLPIKKQIIFASYGGRNFDDSPKVIYNAICKDAYFENWELIWAFVDPEEFNPIRGRKIKMDSVQFFVALLSSRVWVSNSGMDRNLRLSKKQTIDIETWHGTPFKKIGKDQNEGNSVNRRWKFKNNGIKIRCAQSEYDLKILTRVLEASEEEFLMCDLPRNDELLRINTDDILEIKKRMGIPLDKKVILYMPTYREYLTDTDNACYIAPPIDLNRWKELLGKEYVLLFRAHYAVSKVMGIVENDFVKVVSNYPSINDLYLVSDILISDYSSAYIDYSILKRPMFCFAYDLEEYERKRGLYIDIRKELPCSIDEDEESLLQNILTMNHEDMIKRTEQFHKKYSPNAGTAAEHVVAKLKMRLGE